MAKAFDERYEFVKILGKPALFTTLRIEKASVPEGMQRYEIRHADDNGIIAAQIGHGIMVNHMGTLLMRGRLPLDEDGFLDIEDGKLEFGDGASWELEEYIQKYPLSGQRLDATKEAFEERLIGASENEPVLFHPGVIGFATVPEELQVLYAYEDEYGIQLFAPGKTIPVMPFAGTYISRKTEGSLLTTRYGETTLCHREIFTGREGKMTLQDYMRENSIEEKPAPAKKKQEPER